MPIVEADLKLRLSVRTGSAGNSTAQGDGALSWGKYLSTSAAPTSVNALFPALSAADNAAATLHQYLCLFLLNDHATLTWRSPKLWLTDPAGGALVAIAVDSTAASIKTSAAAQALEVTAITNAPTALTFTAPTSYATGLSLGDIPAGYCRAFWVRRSANNSGGVTGESPTFSWQGGTLG